MWPQCFQMYSNTHPSLISLRLSQRLGCVSRGLTAAFCPLLRGAKAAETSPGRCAAHRLRRHPRLALLSEGARVPHLHLERRRSGSLFSDLAFYQPEFIPHLT